MNVADEHSRWDEDLAAFAVGALDSEETVAFADHLARCDRCRGELHRLAPAVELLPASVEQLAPPPQLRGRIMAAVAAEQQAGAVGRSDAAHAGAGRDGAGADAAPLRPSLRARLRGWHVPALPAALTAAALAAAFAIGFAVRGDDGGTSAVPPRTTVPAVATAAAGGAPVQAQLISDGSGSWQLEVDALPRAGDGRVYQAWVMRRGRDIEPSTVFVLARDGSSTVAIPQALAVGDQVLVTEEPAGGSPAPTTRPLLSATV